MSEGIQNYLVIKSCVLQNKKLTPIDKLVLSEIDYQDIKVGKKRGCWMSNANIGKFLGVSASYVSSIVQKLEELKLINYSKEGRRRVLTSNLLDEPTGMLKKLECQYSKAGIEPTRMLNEPTGMLNEPYQNVIPKTIIDKNTKINKNNNTILSMNNQTRKIFNKLQKNKQEDITEIFDFWNSYKQKGIWKKHIKLTPEMIDIIIENLKTYLLDDIFYAIDNYALILQNDKYFWTHIWPLSIFLSVKKGPAKDAYKKWWQFLPENFVIESYLKHDKSNNSYQSRSPKSAKPLPEDPDPQFTQYIIDAWKQNVAMMDVSSFPNYNTMKHFIKFTIKVTTKYKFEEDWRRKRLANEFIAGVLLSYKKDRFRVKDGVLEPWHLTTDHFWNVYLPQWYLNNGVPLDCVTSFHPDAYIIKKMVVEEEQLTKDIESNLERQNQNSKSKVISETDDPELDYIRNV